MVIKKKSFIMNNSSTKPIDKLFKPGGFSIDIVRLILNKMTPEIVKAISGVNKYMNKKVCNDNFWVLYYENMFLGPKPKFRQRDSEKLKTEITGLFFYLLKHHLEFYSNRNQKRSNISKYKLELKSYNKINGPQKQVNNKHNLERCIVIIYKKYKKYININQDNNKAIRLASKKGLTNIVELLLNDSRIDLNDVGINNYIITVAIKKRHIDILKLLLKDPRIDPTFDNNFVIRKVSKKGYSELMKILLNDNPKSWGLTRPRVDVRYKRGAKRSVDPSVDDNYPIKIASESGNTEVVKLLLSDPRVDPTVNNNGVIKRAAKNGHVKVVKILLDDGRIDPTTQDNYALQWSSRYCHTDVVKLLLADSRVRNSLSDAQLQKYQSSLDDDWLGSQSSLDDDWPGGIAQ